MICTKCGHELNEGDVICGNCGEYITDEVNKHNGNVKEDTYYNPNNKYKPYNEYESIRNATYDNINNKSATDYCEQYRNVEPEENRTLYNNKLSGYYRKTNPIINNIFYIFSISGGALLISALFLKYMNVSIKIFKYKIKYNESVKLFGKPDSFVLLFLAVIIIILSIIKSKKPLILFDVLTSLAIFAETLYNNSSVNSSKKSAKKKIELLLQNNDMKNTTQLVVEKEVGYYLLVISAVVLIIGIMIYVLNRDRTNYA